MAHTELWIFALFLFLANQNRYTNEVSNHALYKMTDNMGSTTHIPRLTKIGHCILIEKQKVHLFGWQAALLIFINPSIPKDRVTMIIWIWSFQLDPHQNKTLQITCTTLHAPGCTYWKGRYTDMQLRKVAFFWSSSSQSPSSLKKWFRYRMPLSFSPLV